MTHQPCFKLTAPIHSLSARTHTTHYSRINSDWSFGRGYEPPILGKRRWQGVGDGTIRKSVGEFLSALRGNFSSIFSRFGDIAAFVFQHDTFFPTHLVSRKFHHFPLGVGGWTLGYDSEGVGLIVRAISFQDLEPMWSWSTNVTDGQTDDMQLQYRTLHYSASCGKNCILSNHKQSNI